MDLTLKVVDMFPGTNRGIPGSLHKSRYGGYAVYENTTAFTYFLHNNSFCFALLFHNG